MTEIDLLKKALERYTVSEISKTLDVNKGTVNRWILLNNVPSNYKIDFYNLLDIKYNIGDFSYIEKDQFFTPQETSIKCLNILKKVLQENNINFKDYIFIEPSLGDGSFYNIMPENKRIGIDIEPRIEGTIKKDFLKWFPNDEKKYITLGNPPFGLRGNLALRFINHASNFSDFVAFILPPLFNSDGKGTCRSRVKNMNLIYNENMNVNFYYPNGDIVGINVVFQIWSKILSNDTNKKPNLVDYLSEYIKIYSLSDGGTPGSTRNKNMQDKCHYYIPSTLFDKSKMKLYSKFEDLPNRRGYGILIKKEIDSIKAIIERIYWEDVSFIGTNSSYNLRTSLILESIYNSGLNKFI